MHYWVQARKQERPIPDVKAHFLIRNVQKRQYLSSLRDIKDVTTNLRNFDIVKGK